MAKKLSIKEYMVSDSKGNETLLGSGTLAEIATYESLAQEMANTKGERLVLFRKGDQSILGKFWPVVED